MKFHEFFNECYVINLATREDRFRECVQEFDTAKLPRWWWTRWEAYTQGPTPQSSGTHTHRDILRHIAKNKIPRALVLEDDFAAITVPMLEKEGHIRGRRVLDNQCSVLDGGGTFVERFESMMPYLPPDWDFLYLGGGYGEAPISRFSKHCIRTRTIKGTHAFGVTCAAAEQWTKWIDERTKGDLDYNCGAADDMITSASTFMRFYMLEPRILVQRPSLSNLTQREENYLDSMTNPDHVAALDKISA